MKILMIFLLPVILFSCQSGTNGTPNGDPKGAVVADSLKDCSVKFSKADSLEMIAIKANRLRIECNVESTSILEQKLTYDLDGPNGN